MKIAIMIDIHQRLEVLNVASSQIYDRTLAVIHINDFALADAKTISRKLFAFPT